MTFDLRLIVIALASFTVASVAASTLLAMLSRRTLPAAAAAKANYLFRLRLLPATLAAAALVLAVASFIEFEPREREAAGLTLRLLATVALLPLAAGAWRLGRLWLATHRARRAWLQTGERIALRGVRIPAFAVDSAFPIVAVVGVLKPVLVIARSVLAQCTPEEMRAILAHEGGHIARRDNLRRAALLAAPDFMGRLTLARHLTEAWDAATEEAADDDAGRIEPEGRLGLASALIRVARLAPAGIDPIDVPASALFRGQSVEGRVRRLLEPELVADAPAASRWRIATRIVLLAGCVLALQAIHEAVELAVTFLP